MSNRFDPEEGKPYAMCLNCDEVMQTNADNKAHFDETWVDGRSHTVSLTNPTRPERIKSEVGWLVQDAFDELLEKIDLLTADVTESEMRDAICLADLDLLEAWEEWNK